MRTTTPPALPTLGSAPEWVAAASRAGLRLEVAHTGRRLRLHRAARLAARAILATALDNAAQHADTARPVLLALRWEPSGLSLRVLNVPGEMALDQLLRPGRGIGSMTARAHRAGGWLRAGLCDDGFEVEAFLPVASAPAARAGRRPVPQWPLRISLWAAAWATGRTTISSRLMWCGTVTAYRTTSATSSAVSGSSTPA